MMLSSSFTKLLVLSSALTAVVGTMKLPIHEVDISNMDPTCPTVNHYTAPYHLETACNIVEQNLYKEKLQRWDTHKKLLISGVDHVPSEHTNHCPELVQPLTSEGSILGFDTAWIVENTATTPVVVAFLQDSGDGTFAEVSALNPKISPPHHDPKAVLKPGEYTSVLTHEGHVFHVRQILKDGGLGPILMQHRVGLIPITNKYGHELDCNPTDPDFEPIVETFAGEERDPDYARTPPKPLRPCNMLDIGFRNQVGCPLNAYYTGMYQMKGVVKPRGNVTKLKLAGVENPEGHTAKSCHEIFKFHMGLQEETPDFMWDWASKTKYESSFVGHNFVFRYANDERIVVDSVTLQPSRVIDCPGLKKQIGIASVVEAEAVISPVGITLPHLVSSNATTTLGLNATTTGPAVLQPPTAGPRRRRTAGASIMSA